MVGPEGAEKGPQVAEDTRQGTLARPHELTFLESRLPFRELSLVAKADQRSTDPVYAAHRWWARRPPGVMRGLLVADALPASSSLEDFWRDFQSPGHPLSGLRVLDPFLGGGTTAVEAARLGAIPHGYDVDPLSVLIVKHELSPPDPREFETAASALLAYLNAQVADLYSVADRSREPLHYFHLHEVACPACGREAVMHRSLVIARDVGKRGAVVRDAATVAFCPDCFSIKHIDDPARGAFRCCGHLRRLEAANYSGGRFRCPHCAYTAQHGDLLTGVSPRKLLAVEETSVDDYRRIRSPTRTDRQNEKLSSIRLTLERASLDIPSTKFRENRTDARPVSFGAKRPADLFSARQLLVFGHAFRWTRNAHVSNDVRSALNLTLSNALTTNNKLCGYATDYGRLAPLFSVRSYSLPLLPVELNPLHRSGGRGTLTRAFARTADSSGGTVRRYVWSPRRRRALPKTFSFAAVRESSFVTCASAESPPLEQRTPVDLCVFDPPYFDFISYSELSEFYRAWLSVDDLGGMPLLPSDTKPIISFGMRFARALRSALSRLAHGRPLAFTYHSGNPDAWEAIGLALDHAGLSVTAIWPVRNDGHMGHHTNAGNCEWDAVVVCRRTTECVRAQLRQSVIRWKPLVRPLAIRKADA